MILNVENTTPERRKLWVEYEELTIKISQPNTVNDMKNVWRRQLQIVEAQLGGDKC